MSAEIEQALIQQNPHWEGKDYQHAFKRLHDTTVIDDLEFLEIQIITGIRRSGKSTLLQTLINHIAKTEPRQSIVYINLDDPAYTELCNDAKSLHDIITTCEKLHQESVQFLIIDEVQNLKEWEKYIKSVYDSNRFKKIILSGSNADLLNSEYATLLSGRYLRTHIYPLSFHELLINHDIHSKADLVREKSKVLGLIDLMLAYGGFPRIHCLQKEEQRIKLLKSYYETILLKDCIANHNIRDSATLTQLSHYLINNISCLYSYNSLQKIIGSNENTIQNYIHILQDAYFIHQLSQYSYSLKTQSRNRKKPYCIDNGLITAATFKFSNNHGKLLENMVYAEFKKSGSDDIFYNNDTNECDFIIHSDIKSQSRAVQVCYQLDNENIKREVNGLINAMKKYDIPNGIIITYDDEQTLDASIKAIPFWRYFFKETNNHD